MTRAKGGPNAVEETRRGTGLRAGRLAGYRSREGQNGGGGGAESVIASHAHTTMTGACRPDRRIAPVARGDVV
jgi:hypothetical protein